jgi:transposase-like protein
MDMDVHQATERNEAVGGGASPAPRGRPGRRGAEEKTQAVLELLGGKTTIDALARRFGVREQTVEQWRQDAIASIAAAMRQGDSKSSTERALEKELHGLKKAFTDLAIRHELVKQALELRPPSRPGRSVK